MESGFFEVEIMRMSNALRSTETRVTPNPRDSRMSKYLTNALVWEGDGEWPLEMTEEMKWDGND